MVDCGPLGDDFGRYGHDAWGVTRWDVASPFVLTGHCPRCGYCATHYLTRVDVRDPGVCRECVSCGHVWDERMGE